MVLYFTFRRVPFNVVSYMTNYVLSLSESMRDKEEKRKVIEVSWITNYV